MRSLITDTASDGDTPTDPQALICDALREWYGDHFREDNFWLDAGSLIEELKIPGWVLVESSDEREKVGEA